MLLPETYQQRRQRLNQEWMALLDQYCPLHRAEDLWRFSRAASADDPPQGWKLHVSATVLNAPQIASRCFSYLAVQDVMFKAAASLHVLSELNSGLKYGFSQVGKCMTVYARSAEQALEVGQHLVELTRDFSAPAVPYDLPLAADGCVYYRYGGFHNIEFEHDGQKMTAIRMPSGKLVPDRRAPGHAVPDWVENPFAVPATTQPHPSLLSFPAYDVLSQRGKGGVYRSLDLSSLPIRKCILKEGRRVGEVTWDNRDGGELLRHEEWVLRSLHQAGVPVPAVHTAFDIDGHRYLVTEEIEGQALHYQLMNTRRKLPLAQCLHFGWQLVRLVRAIHQAGWVWRDCKPFNVIATSQQQLVAIDFEGASRLEEYVDYPWGTPGYMSKRPATAAAPTSNQPEDLYALGAALYQLFTSLTPLADTVRKPIGQLRKGIPAPIRQVIHALLAADWAHRPELAQVEQLFNAHLPAQLSSIRQQVEPVSVRQLIVKDDITDYVPNTPHLVLKRRAVA